MKKGRMAEIVKELQGASKMHLKQSKEIAEHIDDMGSPANMGKGDSYKKGELIDETDHEDSMYKSTNSSGGLISGTDYNVENVSEIQKDKKGQFMTSLDESEYYGGPKPTSSTVSNYDQGRNQTRDTLRPAVGKRFLKTYDNPINKNKFGGTPDSTDKQAAYEKATNQLYDEGTITETDDKAVKLIKKRVKKNAKKLSK